MTGEEFRIKTHVCRHCYRLKKRLNDESLCKACEQLKLVDIARERIYWKQQFECARQVSFANILSEFDMIMAFSGGADSTRALSVLKRETRERILAITIETGLSRHEVLDDAIDFCRDNGISHLVIHADLRKYYFDRNPETNRDIKTLLNFDWCGTCNSVLFKLLPQVAKVFGIRKIFLGFNYPLVSMSQELTPFQTDGFEKVLPDFLPPDAVGCSSIIAKGTVFSSFWQDSFLDHIIVISILPAFDNTLSDKAVAGGIGKRFSDCVMLPALQCARKSVYVEPNKPKGGGLWEFLWGYYTREEWLDEIMRINCFSEHDSDRAVAYIKKKVLEYEDQSTEQKHDTALKITYAYKVKGY